MHRALKEIFNIYYFIAQLHSEKNENVFDSPSGGL